MAIIKAPPKQPKSVTIQARVEESVKIQLDLYAQFIASTPSYVISEALKWHGKLGDPKTEDSIRVVELSPQASEHLKTSLKSWRPNELRRLFATRTGRPWDQNALLKRKFEPLLKALGIRVPRGDGFYILRHGNATLMSSFGAPQKLRQERLGHADGSPVTETIYTHVISEDGKRVAARLGSAVWGSLPESWTHFGCQLDVNGRKKENGLGMEPPKPFLTN